MFLLCLPHRNVWQALHSVLATFTGLPSECTAQTQGIVFGVPQAVGLRFTPGSISSPDVCEGTKTKGNGFLDSWLQVLENTAALHGEK